MTDEIAARSRVVVSKPRSFHGVTGPWQDRKGRVKARYGGLCDVLLEGETEVLGFFVDELTVLPAADKV
jgi:hypothetical protein